MKIWNSSAVRLLSLLASSAILVSGCAIGDQAGGDGSQSTVPNEKPSEVKDPREASGASPCDLLKAGDAQAMGLEPTGEVTPNQLDPTMPDSCEWQSPGGETSVALSAIPGRSIQQYRESAASYVDFAEMEIAGHPAVQANNAPPESGSCGIYLATKDDQILFSFAFDTPPGEKFDPCSYAKGALERSVPGLPSAK
ncbi:hypothetical protein GCM10027271_18240 [Saccharopolyspora gloriosae]|uniref:DUF3558 domain-containing protein n=1 Tax=Saccharopolyspora gloriosae TaxID=455344 RepID=A0A840N6U8_9PSEU|nr:DUF3558 domain-containing protein [Saccharopolyspora gloriosae]MBB5067374.1 hypothetical protein [Saccharopolyspora gloriosae]